MPTVRSLLSYYRLRLARHAIEGVLLLALLLRGLIPVGYMPQSGTATSATILPLALCHGSGAPEKADITRWLTEMQEERPQSEPEPPHAQTPCLFALCLAQGALPAPQPEPWVMGPLRQFGGALRPVTVQGFPNTPMAGRACV